MVLLRTNRLLVSDILATLTVAMLPWSTSVFQVLLLMWLYSVLFLRTVAWSSIPGILRQPLCLLPLAIFLLAVVGMAWSQAPWQAMSLSIRSADKFLALPFILYHFERSHRSGWVFAAFLASCSALLILSWVEFYFPELKLAARKADGIPVKNYINQSQELALCMIAMAPVTMALFKQKRTWLALAATGLIALFFANIIYVSAARTALLYVPAMLGLFALKYLDRRQSLLLLLAVVVVAIGVSMTSSFFKERTAAVSREYELYLQNVPESTGLRLEYWQKSLRFFAEAPIIGHGTGSAEGLFLRDAVGKEGLEAVVTRNPHNQTLAMAIQWGLIGVILLYAMWIVHLQLFRGNSFACWIGALVVTQNIFSSLLNSHLFDFHEGWMYVVGVGICGGVVRRAARQDEGRYPSY